MWQCENQRAQAHDDHARGDEPGFVGPGSPPVISDRDDGQKGAQVVRTGDEPGLSRMQPEPAFQRRNHHVGENHPLHDARYTECG